MSSLQRKVNKVLSSRVRVDTPDVATALKGLSEFYLPGQNTTSNQRKLRSELERRGVEINRQLVAAFAEVKAELDAVDQTVSDLNNTCTEITTRLQSARSSTALLVAKTTELQLQQYVFVNVLLALLISLSGGTGRLLAAGTRS